MPRFAAVMLAAAALLAAADKKPPVKQAATDKLAITATLIQDKDAIKQEVGSDLGGYFILVKVDLTPKSDKPLAINRDDFLLRSYNDGQKCQPYAPSQIAGRSVLVVSSTGSGGGVMADDRGPAWGGIGGGPPRRLPGNKPVVGNTAEQTSAQATIQTAGKEKENPVLAALEQKVLPDKETREPLSGLLYFSLEGKHKPKDLVLQYNGAGGRLSLEFK